MKLSICFLVLMAVIVEWHTAEAINLRDLERKKEQEKMVLNPALQRPSMDKGVQFKELLLNCCFSGSMIAFVLSENAFNSPCYFRSLCLRKWASYANIKKEMKINCQKVLERSTEVEIERTTLSVMADFENGVMTEY
ncbi:hypothetical protein CDAR_400791 [Caerostris darwini]|uniref:Uncharacterized protein n=1 Tax=Caerostris darwini TaxID=1538125 RepID=A0AAV4NAS6_9ARAC|nr:hypothetical protein CDAR_400791 [Caerostris darwini]